MRTSSVATASRDDERAATPTAGIARARRAGRFGRAWAILLEFVAGLAALGWVSSGACRIVCWSLAGVLLLLAVVPSGPGWLIGRVAGTVGIWSRARAQRRRTGLAVLVGPYTISAVRGRDDEAFGVARTASTATVVIELRAEDLFDPTPPIPIAELSPLLSIEGIPLADVRLLTWAVPAGPVATGPAAAEQRCRSVVRYLALTIAADSAADELSARGGGEAGLQQLLRRMALRGREVAGHLGLDGTVLDPVGLTRLLESGLGALTLLDAPGRERWNRVELGASTSRSFTVQGRLDAGQDRVNAALAQVPADLAVSALVLCRDEAEELRASLVLRLTSVHGDLAGVDRTADRGLLDGQWLNAVRRDGIQLAPLDGRQLDALVATLPIGSI